MPRLKHPRIGPGPMGEETLFSDMHRERLRSILSDMPEVGVSLRFILEESASQVNAYTNSLALAGMEEKEFDAKHGHGPERGKDIMEKAWDIEAGGGLALKLVQEKLDL